MKKLLATVFMSATLPLTAFAVDDAIKDQIETRQAIMTVHGFYMGKLGAMAKGKIPYDAELASRAANNMLTASKIDGADLWAPGTDNSVAGLEDLTSAKPDGWERYDEISKIDEKLKAALVELAANAGGGLDALRGNIGGVGKNCKACHDIGKAK